MCDRQLLHHGQAHQVLESFLFSPRVARKGPRLTTGIARSQPTSAHLYPFDPEEHGHLVKDEVLDDSKPSKELIDSDDEDEK